MNSNFSHYQCSFCGAEYAPGEVIYTCPKDGDNLDILLDYERLRETVTPGDFDRTGESSLWRYLSLLPVTNPSGEGTPLRRVGWTPVYTPEALKSQLGLRHLWIKDESPNPTASFKDRASAVVVARAREIEAEVVVTASTGNAGAALAGMAAAVGQKAIIFAPRTAPPAKVAQLLVFGAQVILVEGNYDQAFDLSVEASQEFGWYCRNTGYNPFTAEGKKTAAYEIWEQLTRGKKEEDEKALFDRLVVFVSVGDGNIITGIHKGFKDLLALGWIEKIPRIFGVQSQGSAAIANAFFDKTEIIEPVSSETLADSISVDLPRDGLRALRAATRTNGAYIRVSDERILDSIADLGKVGVFAEPAGAAAYAGLVKAVEEGQIKSQDPVLVINTGSGLKDVSAAVKAVEPAVIIEPTLDALKQKIQG